MIRVEDEYTNATAASAGYPHGSAKNAATPGSTDGTPWELLIINDFLGMLQALVTEGDVTPSGVPETVLASDTLTSLTKLFQRVVIHADTGVADSYILTNTNSAKQTSSYSDSDLIIFKVANTNTGASTARVGTLAVKSLTLPDGTALSSDTLFAGEYATVKYDSSNDRIELISVSDSSAGIKIAQQLYIGDGEVATGTTIIPQDDTIPQITEGDEYMALVITPTDATSELLIEVVGQFSNSGTDPRLAMALFKDAGGDALSVASLEVSNATDDLVNVTLRHRIVAGSTIAQTFKIRAGAQSGTTTFNGILGSRVYGGVLTSSITITEVEA